MDDNQIAAEILATREVLTNVLHNLANDPLRRAAIRRGFDEASDLVSRRQSDLAHHALNIIDEMRAAALRD